MNLKENMMYRNQIWKWVFFLLLCIFSGCGKEDVPLEVINPDDYIPYVKEGKTIRQTLSVWISPRQTKLSAMSTTGVTRRPRG